MNRQEYNGWTNYETWATHLWLSNEEGSYNYWRDAAGESFRAAVDLPEGNILTPSEQARYHLAERLKDEIEENIPPEVCGTMYRDLLGAALSEVNWSEIANALLEECEHEGQKYEYASL